MDLNPGPHGPEPCRCRVLRCPTDSRVVLANTKSTRLMSFGDPLEPSGAGNALFSCDPAGMLPARVGFSGIRQMSQAGWSMRTVSRVL